MPVVRAGRACQSALQRPLARTTRAERRVAVAGTTEAPWTVECDALLWVARGSTAAVEALPPSLRGSPLTTVVGGFVRYRSTPVGPYAEVVGAVGGIDARGPRGSVAFMAVDSAASLVAGRTNWGVPKTLAVVDGAPGAGAGTACSADRPAWRGSPAGPPRGPPRA